MSNFANPGEPTSVLQLILANGDVAAPSIVFSSGMSKGMYTDGTNIHLTGLSASPTLSDEAASKAYVDGSIGGVVYPLLAPDGSATAPSYSFADSPFSGVFLTAGPSSTWYLSLAMEVPATFASGTVTILDYTLLSGATITVNTTGSGGPYDLVEGVNWTASTDNDTTATSLSNAINGTPGDLSASSLGSVISISSFISGSGGDFSIGLTGDPSGLSIAHTDPLDQTGQEAVRFSPGGANETALLVWDTTANTMQRVSIGASDSGGTGFRVLRIPN